MHPIKEFDFKGLDKLLSLEFIKLHNSIYRNLKLIKDNNLGNQTIINYLNIYFTEFDILTENDEKLVFDTIICASKSKINKLSTINFNQNIKLHCSKLTYLEMYEKLADKKDKLERITTRTNAQNNELKSISTKLDSQITFLDLIGKIFDYSAKRKFLLMYFSSMNYKVCVYCLAQNTSIYKSNKKKEFYLTGNLDHVKPKSKFPFISLSINNLVPVCGHCNQRKLDRNFKYDPFNSFHIHNFDFSKCVDYNMDKSEIEFKGLADLEITPKTGDFIDLSKELDFENLYKNFSKNAELLTERFRNFNSLTYKEMIENTMIENTNNRNIHNSALEYFISEVPFSEDSILMFPLIKFKMDLYNHLKNISKK